MATVEQAIGRDRVRKALKRYEPKPTDRHAQGIVRAIHDDGAFEVLLPGAVETTRCGNYCSAMVGDIVAVVIRADGSCAAIGRLGGESALIVPTMESRFQGIEADIDLLNTNKVLWSGANYMQAEQTCTLSEPISEQPNGIILAWSWYSTNTWTADDFNWMFTPVPKWFPAAHSGCGVNAYGFSWDGNMSKYVYVTDTTIKGWSENGTDFSRGGVDYANTNYVLRAVIGY